MSQLRAVVELVVDSKGVLSGVAAANRALKGLGADIGGRGALGGSALGGIGGGPGQWASALFGAATERMAELQAMAVKSSPEAMSAAMRAEFSADADARSIGKAIGPYAAAIENQRAAAASARAAATVASADEIGAGMLNAEAVKGTLSTVGQSFVDSAVQTMGNFDSPGPLTTAMQRTGATDALAEALVPVLQFLDSANLTNQGGNWDAIQQAVESSARSLQRGGLK